jgi:hypothetical protein
LNARKNDHTTLYRRNTKKYSKLKHKNMKKALTIYLCYGSIRYTRNVLTIDSGQRIAQKGNPVKKFYEVSFKWYDTTTHCTNIVHAESPEAVTAHYTAKGHTWVGEPAEASEYRVQDAKRRGMPIIEL